MKTISIMMMTLALLTGCAGQRKITALERRIEELTLLNSMSSGQEQAATADPARASDEEILQSGQRSADASATTGDQAAAAAQTPAFSPIMAAVLSVRARQEMVMPSNVAWQSMPPASVCAPRLVLGLTNESGFHWALALNGKDVLIEGRPLVLAPRQKIWFCLPDAGSHELVGVAYLPRAGMLEEANTQFVYRDAFGAWVNQFIGHNEASITDNTPRFNQLRISS